MVSLFILDVGVINIDVTDEAILGRRPPQLVVPIDHSILDFTKKEMDYGDPALLTQP